MDRRFYDLDIRSEISSGKHPVNRLVRRAEQLGFDGIAISDYVVDIDDLDRVSERISDADTAIDVHLGAKLKPDDGAELGRMLDRFRQRSEVVVVHGGDSEVNRAATEDARVDILAHPEHGRTDPGINHVMAEMAGENQVAIQLNLRRLLETYGKVRSHVLSHFRDQVRLAEKFDAPVIVSSGATSVWHLRAPRELASILRVLGADVGQSFDAVSSVPRSIVERAAKVTSEEFIRPGVEVVDDE